MNQAFKYFRIIFAIILPIIPLIHFISDLISQSNALLDGPLSWYFSYTFAINDIALAVLISIVLLFDYEIILPSWGKKILGPIGWIALTLSLAGFLFLIMHNVSIGISRYEILVFVELYLFQTAYVLISLLVLGKAYQAKWSHMNYEKDSNA